MLAGSSGLLRAGVLRAVAPLLVPRAILRCRAEAPRLQIRLYEDSLDNLLPALHRHELDCVIGRLHGLALGREFHSEAEFAAADTRLPLEQVESVSLMINETKHSTA